MKPKPNRVLKGGKKPFTADKIERQTRIKIVSTLEFRRDPATGEHLAKRTREAAFGSHGWAYNLTVYKGKHKQALVVKQYRNATPECQTRKATDEFKIFQRLKRKGYHVPPTIRLVEIEGRKYLALTDLTKFGKVLTKWENRMESYAGRKAMEEAEAYVTEENARALKEERLKLGDSWEYVLDSKTKKVRAFILDLGIAGC